MLFRSVAERIVRSVYEWLDRPVSPSRSASTPLPHVALAGDALLEHAARHEMVVTLADAVLRRTPLGSLGRPDSQALEHAGAVVGHALGWSPERQREEIAAVNALY